MKKNKLIIALSSLIIIVIIGVAIIIGLNKKKPITKDIYLARWDKYDEKNFVIEVPTDDVRYSLPFMSSAAVDNFMEFYNGLEYETLEYPILDLIENVNEEVKYVFINNNYYAIYLTNDNTMIIKLIAMELVYYVNYDIYNIYVPINGISYLNSMKVDYCIDELSKYFESNDFNNIIGYYSKFDENVTIDMENETIYFVCVDQNEDCKINVAIDYKLKELRVMVDGIMDEYVVLNKLEE